MRRRQFLGYTGLTASAILAGGLLSPSEIIASGFKNSESHRVTAESRPRMNGGRCHDHRFLNNEPTLSFEREIFGI
ncbi:MAG: hypothetical protein V3W18_04625 [candidate division Zixibacteria bacterium]